jgi:hypothetical protein
MLAVAASKAKPDPGHQKRRMQAARQMFQT